MVAVNLCVLLVFVIFDMSDTDDKSVALEGGAASRGQLHLGMPHYNGNGCVRRFLDDFDRYARLQAWGEERKVDIFPLCLSGIARDAYDALSSAQQQTFQGAAEGLKSSFSQRSAVEYHLALRNLKYDPSESLDNFIIRFRKHVNNAFPNQPAEGQGELLFNHFLSTLPDEYYSAVIADGISSFDEAVTKVRNKRSSVRGRAAAAVREVSVPAVGADVVAQLQRRIAELEAKLESRPSGARPVGSSRRPFECFACGKTGHMRRQCAHSRHRCQQCNTVGHLEEVCGRYFTAGNEQGTGPGPRVRPSLNEGQ